MNAPPGYLLIVEDDPDILKLLETTLRFNGYRVSTARNGYEGLEAIQSERPALVVADIMMPKLDGFGLLNRLRIDPATREIPVVFITATYVAQEDREFAQNIGVTSFIQKPIDLEDFLETVRELLIKGVHVAAAPLKDFDFYEGYRKRLDSKLAQKSAQIARDELLLESTLSDEDRHAIQASVTRAINEREEIKLLLEQIDTQLKRH